MARDLNNVHFWQLKEWITGEVALEDIQLEESEGWRARAQALIKSHRHQQRDTLDITLAELFSE